MSNEHSLKTYSRTNKYYHINGVSIAVDSLLAYVYCNDSDYDIEFGCQDDVSSTMRLKHEIVREHYVLRHLSFDKLWLIIKPYGEILTNYIIIGFHSYDNRYNIWDTYYTDPPAFKKKATQIGYKLKLMVLIYDKLHESETAFRQRLLCSSQTDCKIDFF
jgi:hypothetical protein